jgi:hypothetical protein
MLVGRLLVLLGLVCVTIPLAACDRCSFRLLHEETFTHVVDCCGTSARDDVAIGPGTNRQVDLTNTLFPPEFGRVDVWLAPGDCDQLFDGPYPGAAPRCRTLIGPVAPGEVSARIKVEAGIYRVFAQAYSSNAGRAEYVAKVGSWGNDCKPSLPTQP